MFCSDHLFFYPYQYLEPPIITSLHWKSRRWLKKFWKKIGSSSLGAYKVARVIYFPSDSMSHMINLPFTSEYDRRIWKEKLLLKSISIPPFELEQQLKSALYPHSADQNAVFSLEQCTSCNRYMQNLFALSHLNISLLFCLSPYR